MMIAKLDRSVPVARPVHAHDCQACYFLGRLDGEDLYACDRQGTAEFVRRFGSEPQDFGSLGDHAPKGTALSLAKVLWGRRRELHTRWRMFTPRVYTAIQA